MKSKKNVFSNLKKICFFSMVIKSINIPIGIIVAIFLSKVTNLAVAGEKEGVLRLGITLIITLVLIKVFQSAIEDIYKKEEIKNIHKCKIDLYQRFLSNPLHILYDSKHGASIEKLNDDFNTIARKSLSLLPDFWIGILTIVVYFVYIAFQNILVAVILLVISLLQIVPPVIVKKYMQTNYDNCRDIEAKITDFTAEAYRGFATIKLYELKQWWLNKLDSYHKKYIKIGKSSIYTATAESTLNEFVTMILKYGTYAIMGLLVFSDIINIEVGIRTITLSGELFSAVKMVFLSIPDFAVVKVAEKRLSEWNVEYKEYSLLLKDGNIHLDDVIQSFGEKELLKEITLSFSSDKIYIIKGDNGIGKSTILKLIVGLLPCESGKVTVGNVEPAFFCTSLFPRTIFYLPQEDVTFAFTPYMLYGMVDDKLLPDVLSISKRFHLTEKQIYETKINELSGGERKKVYLSLAFAINPIYLFLDEPTNFLDEDSRYTLIDLLRKRQGGALIITHDPLLEDVSECIYKISGGVVEIETNECV